MKHIMFICTANVFRSMSAEYLMRKYLEDNKIKDILISSAGTNAGYDYPYSEILDRLEHYGCDATRHKPTRTTKEVLDNADIIICMTKRHQEIISKNFGKKSFLFNQIASGLNEDVMDDYEYSIKYGHDFDMKEFIYTTVDHIKNSIPAIYNNVKEHMGKQI